MDTKFWGPPGWKLLHVLTLTYEPSNATKMGKFLETLPYVLPCKFCRASLTDYYRELPFKSALKSRGTLTKWLWQIHSLVNDKLRAQGQTIGPDPSLEEVKTIYGRYIPSKKTNQCELFGNKVAQRCANSVGESFPGWDFLFSIAYNHPLSVRNSKPMPQAPTILKDASDEELNKWNVLAPAKRLIHWRKFWELLPQVMPAPWASSWLKAKQEPILDSRRQTVAWLWRLRCRFSDGADPYTVICNKLSAHESGCSKSLRARTCRRLRRTKKLH